MWMMTWDTWFGVQLGKVAPHLMEKLTMDYYKKNFGMLDDTEKEQDNKKQR